MREPRKKKTRTCTPTLASQADKHVLYENSVQCAEAEIDFVDATFKKLRKRRAHLLREDFCGTANSSCEWVRRHADNRAIGVDLDAEVQQQGVRSELQPIEQRPDQIGLGRPRSLLGPDRQQTEGQREREER